MRCTVPALLLSLAASPAAACLAPEGDAAGIRMDAAGLARGHVVDVLAGGALDLAGCGPDGGHGAFPPTPDIRLNLVSAPPGGLGLRTEGACDAVLLVLDPEARWHFDDDGGGGEQAALTLPGAGAGTYAIWVGSYHPGSCRARLVLGAASPTVHLVAGE